MRGHSMNQSSKEEIKPRYEFRTFSKDLTIIRRRMEKLSGPVPGEIRHRTSTETYVLTGNEEVNCKIRDAKLDIKTRLEVKQGLEQWTVHFKSEFPIDQAGLNKSVWPLLGVAPQDTKKSKLDLKYFLDYIKQNNDIEVVDIIKDRYAFSISGVICEFAVVQVGGQDFHTFAVESESVEEVLDTLALLEAGAYRNINYPKALHLIRKGNL